MEKNLISFIDLNKVYDNGYVAVKKFDLNIKKGEFVTLLGPSGCGKTTVLRMLAGFEYPTKGRILHNDLDIKDISVHDRPTATVFQDYALFPNLTVRQNIEYGLKIMRIQSEDVTDEIIKKAENLYQDALKKSQNKIKSIEKKRQELLKQISKCNKEYSRKKGWEEFKTMRYNDFKFMIEKLQNNLYKQYGENFISKQSYLNEFKSRINMLLLRMGISYRLNISIKNMNEIEKEINQITKIYSAKCLLDKKFDNLQDVYNELDFKISYWQNYPNMQKDKFFKIHGSRKLTKPEIHERASKVIELVGLKGKETAMPIELSGGMQQRVALARAIVIEPEIILLDEPLSALDAKVRSQMQKELKRLHNELKITFILVTHDQEEALTLSDKVVVMSQGQIEQVGTPNEIYDYPINPWVAKFIGRANFFDGIFLGKNRVKFLNHYQKVEKLYKFRKNEKIITMIRPEDFDVVPYNKGYINVKVVAIEYKGLLWDIKCNYHDQIIMVEGINKVTIGSNIGLKWDSIDVHLIKYDRSQKNAK